MSKLRELYLIRKMQAECVAECAKWPVCPVCVERVSPFDEFIPHAFRVH